MTRLGLVYFVVLRCTSYTHVSTFSISLPFHQSGKCEFMLPSLMDFISLQMRILLSNEHVKSQPRSSGAGETSLSFMSAKKTMGTLELVSAIVFYSNGLI